MRDEFTEWQFFTYLNTFGSLFWNGKETLGIYTIIDRSDGLPYIMVESSA